MIHHLVHHINHYHQILDLDSLQRLQFQQLLIAIKKLQKQPALLDPWHILNPHEVSRTTQISS